MLLAIFAKNQRLLPYLAPLPILNGAQQFDGLLAFFIRQQSEKPGEIVYRKLIDTSSDEGPPIYRVHRRLRW